MSDRLTDETQSSSSTKAAEPLTARPTERLCNAKSSKDFTTADLIREELKKLNIQVNDSRDGSNWKLNT